MGLNLVDVDSKQTTDIYSKIDNEKRNFFEPIISRNEKNHFFCLVLFESNMHVQNVSKQDALVSQVGSTSRFKLAKTPPRPP